MNIRKIIPILGVIILHVGVVAQSNTMYYLNSAPQSYYLNPATQPQCRFFLGAPVLSSFYFESYNSAFGFSGLFWTDENSGQTVHPLHPLADLDQFFENFKNKNVFALRQAFSPISVGMGIKQMYFTFDITAKLTQGIYYPRDFMEFLVRGNKDNTTYDFSSLGININSYIEYAFGVSRKFSDELQVGIRPKIFTGLINLSSESNNSTLYTSHEMWQMNSDIDIHISMPGFIIPLNEEGVLNLNDDFVFDSTITTVSGYRKLLKRNRGLGIDIGAHYKPIRELTLSVSLIDFGYIKWKSNTHTTNISGSYTFEGFEFSSEDTLGNFDNLLDTIMDNFQVTGSNEAFKTGLEPKLYIGGSYAILPKVDVGLLSCFDFLKSGVQANVLLHANWHPGSFYSLAFTYSPFVNKGSTFGTGVFMRLGPLSYYTIFDYRAFRYQLYKYEDVPVFISPLNRNRFSLRFGLNLVFGCNIKKKLMKDKPMYFSSDY